MALTYSQTAYSSLTITGSAPNQQATISYSGLDYSSDIGDTIEVYNDTTKLTATTNYTLDTTGKNVVLKTNTFTGGTTISVYRKANKTARTVDFVNASVLTEADLDNSALQTFHVAQEALDTAELSITADADGTFNANNKKITNVVAGTSATDVVVYSQISSNLTTTGGYRDDALDHKDTTVDYAVRVGNVVRHFDGASDNTSDSSPADQAGVYSSKEFAIGDLTASGGSAKAWAIDASSPNGSSDKSAKTLAAEAATSAGTATTKASEASTSASSAQASSIVFAIALG